MKISLIFLLFLTNAYAIDADKFCKKHVEESSSLSVQPDLEQGEKWTSLDEKESKKVLSLFCHVLLKDTLESDTPKLMRRDAHGKHHGCVRADIEIDNSKLAKQDRVGLFATNKEYKSWIRFSNGRSLDDTDLDVRGMAVKIMNVDYNSYLNEVGIEEQNPVHDLVFMNSEEFFLERVQDYVYLMTQDFLTWIKNDKFRLFKKLGRLGSAMFEKPISPERTSYFSAVPYKLGKSNIKMKLEPRSKKIVQTRAWKKSHKRHSDYLSERLISRVPNSEVYYDLYVQKNSGKYDIERPIDEWSTKDSPYVKVASIKIHKQKDVAKNQEFCENLTFNPWRAHPENRPMGRINRTRLDVYKAQAKMRHLYNKAPYPRPLDY